MYDNFLAGFSDFVCTKQRYRFEDPSVKESITATRYNYDWEYME
ncbi:MAG: hypothetical protein M5U10_00360 [Candidatus Methanoperedens sp.]|nr:hypothetical protein [Candidatus Methanoperedens sp.]